MTEGWYITILTEIPWMYIKSFAQCSNLHGSAVVSEGIVLHACWHTVPRALKSALLSTLY